MPQKSADLINTAAKGRNHESLCTFLMSVYSGSHPTPFRLAVFTPPYDDCITTLAHNSQNLRGIKMTPIPNTAGSRRATSLAELCVISAHRCVSGRVGSHCVQQPRIRSVGWNVVELLFQTTADGKPLVALFSGRLCLRTAKTLRRRGCLPTLRNSCVLKIRRITRKLMLLFWLQCLYFSLKNT
jgi:hypothetical protein